MSDTTAPVLKVEGLTKRFGHGRNAHLALDNLSFELQQGEVLGLVGESGSGETTAIRCLMGLEHATSGALEFRGKRVWEGDRATDAAFRRDVQLIFQDPFSSLDPRMTVRQILEEPMAVLGGWTATQRRDRILELLSIVGLSPEHLNRYPRHFSGGQRQRIAIVRALTTEPNVLLCDEPVSALDVSVQAQVLNLLRDMQRKLGLSIVFVAHDLAVVKYLCSRIVVLHHGVVAEQGTVEQVYDDPQADYTRALLDAIPIPDPLIERERRERSRAALQS